MRHGMLVARLRVILDALKDDDDVEPNMVGNLRVVRDGQYVGYIDFGIAQALFVDASNITWEPARGPTDGKLEPFN